MIIRVGLPKTTGEFPGALFNLEFPGLISANGLWDQQNKRFREPGFAINDCDIALDSAGYVVMKKWGGNYPWTVQQYVELAGLWSWDWWASMDFCCEPELARDDDEAHFRILNTATHLALCNLQVEAWRAAGASWLQYPMPVLQGWRPDHYRHSAELTHGTAGVWPSLVGVGSVCARPLRGRNGLEAVLEAIDRDLPPHVRLHLFGVKGKVLNHIQEHPRLQSRVHSMDSLAWDFRARKMINVRRREQEQQLGFRLDKHHPLWLSCSNEVRIEAMREWVHKQTRGST